MNENFVIFKNPNLRYRKEEFGGILRMGLKMLIVNKKQFDLIDSIDKIVVYLDLSDTDKKIVDKLIDEKILLKVNIKKAKEMGFKEKS